MHTYVHTYTHTRTQCIHVLYVHYVHMNDVITRHCTSSRHVRCTIHVKPQTEFYYNTLHRQYMYMYVHTVCTCMSMYIHVRQYCAKPHTLWQGGWVKLLCLQTKALASHSDMVPKDLYILRCMDVHVGRKLNKVHTGMSQQINTHICTYVYTYSHTYNILYIHTVS